MKWNKSRLRIKVTDGHLDAVMRIAILSWKQNFLTLSNENVSNMVFLYRELISFMYVQEM